MKLRIGINGAGRVGRCVLRAWQKHPYASVVAINDLTDAETLAYLVRHDSVHGAFPNTVQQKSRSLTIGDETVSLYQEKDPTAIPWQDHGVDVVLECTGALTDASLARAHLRPGGVRKVIISAPAKSPDVTLVIGANLGAYDAGKHHVISNGSCTTNCLAVVAKVFLEQFGIVSGLMTTIHSYTNDQRLLDLPHKDFRRTRAAALSMIPTTTGAAKTIGEVLPALRGKLDGYALRVPTPNVSLLDLNLTLEKPATAVQINQAFVEAASSAAYKGILGTTQEPLVSCDFQGSTFSAVVDLLSTQVVGNQAKILAWYDNEMGYSTRLYELAGLILAGKDRP